MTTKIKLLIFASIFNSGCRTVKNVQQSSISDLQKYASENFVIVDSIFLDPKIAASFQLPPFLELKKSKMHEDTSPISGMTPVFARKITGKLADTTDIYHKVDSTEKKNIDYSQPSWLLPFYTYIPLVIIVLILLICFRWAAKSK